MLLTREEIQNRGSTNQSATRISADFSTSFPGERAWERGCRLHSSAGRIESILSPRREITVSSYEFLFNLLQLCGVGASIVVLQYCPAKVSNCMSGKKLCKKSCYFDIWEYCIYLLLCLRSDVFFITVNSC